MKNAMKVSMGSLAIAMMAMFSSALAVPTIDGTADAEYGTALSVQNTNTQFGDSTTGDPINNGDGLDGGNEIDQVFGTVANGRLYVTIAGNLQLDFLKLEVFIDSDGTTGGVNTIDGANLPDKVDGFCCGPNTPGDGALQRMDGLTFDAGFNADYYLTFTHGFEKVRPDLAEELQFWAMSAHYADLTQGTSGASVAAGMQLAQRGLPKVLRGSTADFDVDGDVDGSDFLNWQRNNGATGVNRLSGDASGDGNVNADDLATWQSAFGFQAANASFDANFFSPQSADVDNSDSLLGPTLPGLSQGELIDQNYALGSGGCNADNSGADCVTREIEFALPIDALNDPNNTFSHRNFDNTIDLELAFDNSNMVGVSDDAGLAGDFSDPTLEDPSVVTTGLEFSIPLSQIGNPTGDINITAFVNNSNRDFISNQFSGVGILAGNVGSLVPDLEAEFAGNQFVTIIQTPGASAVPEPASAILALACALVCGAITRRRC